MAHQRNVSGDKTTRPEWDVGGYGEEERQGVKAVEEGLRGGEVTAIALGQLDCTIRATNLKITAVISSEGAGTKKVETDEDADATEEEECRECSPVIKPRLAGIFAPHLGRPETDEDQEPQINDCEENE
jgi:hypothetical protein